MARSVPPRASLVSVDALVKRYPKTTRHALDGVSFQIEPGELFALLGPNGAGKSTLIGILTTALSPTSGAVRIGDVDVLRQPREARSRMAFVFQDVYLDLSLTVEENVRVAIGLYGTFPYRPWYAWMPAAYRSRVEHLANILGLTGDLFRRARELSGGTRRRAELLRALVCEARLLVLDEPTASLDPNARNELWRHILGLRSKVGSTILVATHFLAEAETADRVLILHQGRVAAEGTPGALRARFARTELVVDGEDPLTLRMELERLGVKFTGSGPFRVEECPFSPHEFVQNLRIRLSALEVHTPTLEEAYLAVTRSEAP